MPRDRKCRAPKVNILSMSMLRISQPLSMVTQCDGSLHPELDRLPLSLSSAAARCHHLSAGDRSQSMTAIRPQAQQGPGIVAWCPVDVRMSI